MAELLDLFGAPPLPVVAIPAGKHRRTTAPKGYAALPGSGPAGKTCRQCKHRVIACPGGSKTFPKCGLMRNCWTHGRGTDIKVSSPACKMFEEKPNGENSQR
jgi:hypothetical protein